MSAKDTCATEGRPRGVRSRDAIEPRLLENDAMQIPEAVIRAALTFVAILPGLGAGVAEA